MLPFKLVWSQRMVSISLSLNMSMPCLFCRVGKVYEWLGLTVGVVVSTIEHGARRRAFEADVTFITAQELCFTFLRDQTVNSEDRIVRTLGSFALALCDGLSHNYA